MRTVVPLVALLTFAILGALLHAVATERAIRLSVSPQVSFAPATLAIQVRVHPEPDDRWIRVELDSETFYRSSGWDVTSDQPVYAWALRDVPSGAYQATAAIGHGDQARAIDRVQVMVSGP